MAWNYLLHLLIKVVLSQNPVKSDKSNKAFYEFMVREFLSLFIFFFCFVCVFKTHFFLLLVISMGHMQIHFFSYKPIFLLLFFFSKQRSDFELLCYICFLFCLVKQNSYYVKLCLPKQRHGALSKTPSPSRYDSNSAFPLVPQPCVFIEDRCEGGHGLMRPFTSPFFKLVKNSVRKTTQRQFLMRSPINGWYLSYTVHTFSLFFL